MTQKACCAAIDAHARELIELSKKIWERPEMGWTEKNASAWTADYLKKQGFAVERGHFGVLL